VTYDVDCTAGIPMTDLDHIVYMSVRKNGTLFQGGPILFFFLDAEKRG